MPMPHAPSGSPGPSRTRSTGRATWSPILTASTRGPQRGPFRLQTKPLLVTDGGSPMIRSPTPSYCPERERMTVGGDTAAAVAAALTDLQLRQDPSPPRRVSPHTRMDVTGSPIKSPHALDARGRSDNISPFPGSRCVTSAAQFPNGPCSTRNHQVTTVGGPVRGGPMNSKDSLRSSKSQPAYAFSRMFSAPSRSVLPTPLSAAETASAHNTSMTSLSAQNTSITSIGSMSPPTPVASGSPAASPVRQRFTTMQVPQMTRRTVGKPVRRSSHAAGPLAGSLTVKAKGGSSTVSPIFDGRTSPPAAVSSRNAVWSPMAPTRAPVSSPNQVGRSVSPQPGAEDSLTNRRALGPPRDNWARDAWVRSAFKRDVSQESRHSPAPLVSRRKSGGRSSSPQLTVGRPLLAGATTAVVRLSSADSKPLTSVAQLSGSFETSSSLRAPVAVHIETTDAVKDFAPRHNSNVSLSALAPSASGGSVTAAPTASTLSPAVSVDQRGGSSTAAPSSAGADAAASTEASLVVQPKLPESRESLRKSLESAKAALEGAKRRHSNTTSAAVTGTVTPRMDVPAGMFEAAGAGHNLSRASSHQASRTSLVALLQEPIQAVPSKATNDRALAKAGARLFVTALRAFSGSAADDSFLEDSMTADDSLSVSQAGADIGNSKASLQDLNMRPAARSPILAKVIVSPYGVLGTQLSRTGQTRVNAPEPGSDVAIVDSMGMHSLQSGPSKAEKEGSTTYSWLGYHKDNTYPPALGQAVCGPADAKFIVYEGKCVCIHVVEPNFTDDPCCRETAVSQLALAYRNVLAEFVASGAHTLRLLPVGGAGTSPGTFSEQFPELTAEALDRGFARMRVEEQIMVLTADRIEICIFMEKDLEAYEKAWEASGILPSFCDNIQPDAAPGINRQASTPSLTGPMRPPENVNAEAPPMQLTNPMQNGIGLEAVGLHSKGKEMDPAEVDEFFDDLADFSPEVSYSTLEEAGLRQVSSMTSCETLLRNADQSTATETCEDAESSLGGWTSEGDDEVSSIRGPLCGRRRPLNFRPGVPLLRLPPPGWGTPGSPFEENLAAQNAAAQAAPRNSGTTPSGPSPGPSPPPANNANAGPARWDFLHQAYANLAQEPSKTPPPRSSVVLVPGMSAPPPPTNVANMQRPARASAPATSTNHRGSNSYQKPQSFGGSMIDPVLAHMR